MYEQEDTSRLRASRPTGQPPINTSPSITYEETPPTTLAPKKKKGLLIGLIIVAVALLILALTYALWFQNPNKVVSDGIIHAVSAKTLAYNGTIAVAANTKMNVTLDGESSSEGSDVNAKLIFDSQGKKYTLEGNGVFSDAGDLYFKLDNIDDLADNYRAAIPTQSQPLFDNIIAKINNKWIKVSSDDVKSYSQNVSKAQRCLTDAVKKIQDDSATKSEVTAIYKEHPFITIDKSLGSKDGSLGYNLTSDQEKAKSFAVAIKNTEVYKTLQKCDSSFTIKEDDPLQQKDTQTGTNDVEVWVHQWTHQITKVVVKGQNASSKTDMTIAPVFNKPVTIEIPKDATTIEQLQKDIQALLNSAAATPAPAQ